MTTSVMGSDPILKVRNVTMRFGGLTAVKSLNMTIPPLSLYGLIGPNGAGKTTVFNVLTGVYCPTEGDITLDGVRIEKKKPYEITKLGAARTFQKQRGCAPLPLPQSRTPGCEPRRAQPGRSAPVARSDFIRSSARDAASSSSVSDCERPAARSSTSSIES